MGLFQRFKKGAPEPGDEDRRTGRSPDQARALVDSLAEELRALKSEIKLLRENLAGSGGRVAESSSGESRRKSRGGRGRGRASKEGDPKVADQRPQEQRRSLPKEPPEDAPVGPLVDYLKGRGVTVFEGSDDLNRNEAFEHLARHLGTHFELLSPFYEKMKRCVATGRGQRIDIDHFSDQERSAAVQFGTLLHRHGMLKDFYYHRSPKKQLRVIPTKDGQVGQFLTGGWLEIYVSLQLLRRLKAKYSPAKFQLLYNVKGTLPDGREFESDLMAAVEGKLFWLECKTGHWQDYAARFRGLVEIFGVDRQSGALLLIRPPDQGTRQRATDMLNMTLLSLSEVDAFINGFLGIEGDEDYDDPGVAPVGTIPPLSDDEIPLENAEPAKKLGRVKLDGDDDDDGEDSSARRKRRRRGRRGGRGRSRSGEESAESKDAGSRDAEAKPKSGSRSLHEALPIEREESADAEAAAEGANGSGEAPAPKAAAELPEGMIADASPAAKAEVEEQAEAASDEGDADGDDDGAERPARKRSRGRRGGRGRRKGGAQSDAEGDESDADAEADAEEEAAEAKADAAPKAEGDAEGDAEGGSEGRSPRRRRKRTRKSPFAVDEDAAEAAEAAEAEAVQAAAAPEQAEAEAEKPKRTRKPKTEAKPEAAEADAELEPEAQPEMASAPEPEPEPEAEAEAEPEAEAAPAPAAKESKTSPKGTVIAPDLAAMMAGGTPPKPDKD